MLQTGANCCSLQIPNLSQLGTKLLPRCHPAQCCCGTTHNLVTLQTHKPPSTTQHSQSCCWCSTLSSSSLLRHTRASSSCRKRRFAPVSGLLATRLRCSTASGGCAPAATAAGCAMAVTAAAAWGAAGRGMLWVTLQHNRQSHGRTLLGHATPCCGMLAGFGAVLKHESDGSTRPPPACVRPPSLCLVSHRTVYTRHCGHVHSSQLVLQDASTGACTTPGYRTTPLSPIEFPCLPALHAAYLQLSKQHLPSTDVCQVTPSLCRNLGARPPCTHQAAPAARDHTRVKPCQLQAASSPC